MSLRFLITNTLESRILTAYLVKTINLFTANARKRKKHKQRNCTPNLLQYHQLLCPTCFQIWAHCQQSAFRSLIALAVALVTYCTINYGVLPRSKEWTREIRLARLSGKRRRRKNPSSASSAHNNSTHSSTTNLLTPTALTNQHPVDRVQSQFLITITQLKSTHDWETGHGCRYWIGGILGKDFPDYRARLLALPDNKDGK